MRAVSEYRAPRVDELDQFTDWHWAGDCVLGKTVGDAGVQYQWTWPMQQTARVWEINPFTEGYGRNAWCHPIVSFHHMTADDVIDMWRFEMNWFGRVSGLHVFLYISDHHSNHHDGQSRETNSSSSKTFSETSPTVSFYPPNLPLPLHFHTQNAPTGTISPRNP